jgi:hypothetical protein
MGTHGPQMMSTDKSQAAIQVHLTEYVALRQEMLEMIKWREQLVFLSLGISGALLSFSFSSDQPVSSALRSRHIALYLVAPLAAALGGLWQVNAMRIYRIGIYIRDVLTPKINALLKDVPTAPAGATPFEVFAWESSNERVMHKWLRRILEWLVLILAFVASGVLAQYLIITTEPGGLRHRFLALEIPWLYVANTVLLFLSLGLFLRHLLLGVRNKASSVLSRL